MVQSRGSTHCAYHWRSGGARGACIAGQVGPRGAIETEGRNRGAKPRGEMKSNGSCVLWLIATLLGRLGNVATSAPRHEVPYRSHTKVDAVWRKLLIVIG